MLKSAPPFDCDLLAAKLFAPSAGPNAIRPQDAILDAIMPHMAAELLQANYFHLRARRRTRASAVQGDCPTFRP